MKCAVTCDIGTYEPHVIKHAAEFDSDNYLALAAAE